MHSRPAMPTVPPHRGAFRARRDWLITTLATSITVLTAAIAILVAAAMFTQQFDNVMLPPDVHVLGTPNRSG